MRTIGSDEIIPLELLQQGSTYYFQKTFYIPSSVVGATAFVGDFSEVLKLEDMPHDGKLVRGSDGEITIEDAGVATNLYVRVASCTSTVASSGITYDFSLLGGMVNAANGAPVIQVPMQNGIGPTDIGNWSEPQRITFPNSNTAEYIKALQTALLVLALSRPDLTPLDSVQDTLSAEVIQAIQAGKYIVDNLVLQRCGLENMKQLAGLLYEDYRGTIEQKGFLPGSFRSDLLQRIEKTAHDIYNKSGSMPDVERFVVEQTQTLRSITWGDIFKEVHPEIKIYIPEYLRNTKLMDSFQGRAQTDVGYGVGANPYSLDCEESIVSNWLQTPGLIQDRKPHMIEGTTGGEDPKFEIRQTVPASDYESFKETIPVGLWAVYLRGRQGEVGNYSIQLSDDDYRAILALEGNRNIVGSADHSPVFAIDLNTLSTWGSYNRTGRFTDPATKHVGVYFCRGLFAKYQGGKLFQEAALALSVAAAATRRSLADGEWWSFRFFDSFPSIEDCLSSLLDMIKSLQGSLDSIVALIMRYISYLEARVVELQQFIRRINALLQSLLGFSFQIPQCSALALTSNGTGGVLADFVSAQNKPSDSPLAYGAGLVALIPFGPGAAMDIVGWLLKPEPGVDPSPDGTLGSQDTGVPDAIGIEGLPAPPPVPPDPAPDVL
jgi:hypothetical protein